MTFLGHLGARLTVPSSIALTAGNASSGGGATAVSVTDGSYYIGGPGLTTTDLCAHLQTRLNAVHPSGWTVTFSVLTGKVTIHCTDTPWSITWTSTDLRDLLGFTGNISSVSVAQTGTKVSPAIWIPDCPINLDGDPERKQLKTDLRATESPSGKVLGIVGNVGYRYKNLRWSHVPRANCWDINGTNGTWENFLLDTQLNQGHPWFRPSAKVYIVTHAGTYLGGSTIDGWYLKGVDCIEPKRVSENTSLWRVEIPEVSTDS